MAAGDCGQSQPENNKKRRRTSKQHHLGISIADSKGDEALYMAIDAADEEARAAASIKRVTRSTATTGEEGGAVRVRLHSS